MKRFKKIGLLLLVVFILLQFIPTHQNKSNEVLASDFNLYFDTPTEIAKKIKVSCYDCHSNNTNYPWYNKVQPVAWFLENHIKEAKEELNFSEFGNYSKRKQKSKLKHFYNEIEKGKMPLFSYTLIHSNAKLSKAETKKMLKWINELKNKIK